MGRGCTRQSAPAVLRRVTGFLREHLAEPVGLAQAAQIAGVHPATLTRQFRAVYGRSIGEYLRSLRVERAASLLKESPMAIAEIALATGFSSQAHMTTALRRALGVTPARLRAMHRM
jgi:AraC family transcriptional regulator